MKPKLTIEKGKLVLRLEVPIPAGFLARADQPLSAELRLSDVPDSEAVRLPRGIPVPAPTRVKEDLTTLVKFICAGGTAPYSDEAGKYPETVIAAVVAADPSTVDPSTIPSSAQHSTPCDPLTGAWSFPNVSAGVGNLPGAGCNGAGTFVNTLVIWYSYGGGVVSDPVKILFYGLCSDRTDCELAPIPNPPGGGVGGGGGGRQPRGGAA